MTYKNLLEFDAFKITRDTVEEIRLAAERYVNHVGRRWLYNLERKED